MYLETINHFANLAEKKTCMLKNHPLAFAVGTLMAGAYVGIGIILIFTVGGYVDASLRPLIMGATFGIALTLVVFAGSELFTGLTMYMTIGLLQKRIGLTDLLRVWVVAWVGNLLGAVLLALIYAGGGGGSLFDTSADLLNKVVSAKMHKSPTELFFLGILCNWLVCLALWTSARTQNDAAKCILIFWCLLAFIACGFEHSVANMTAFSIALLGDHPDTISLYRMGYNLWWVTLGNVIGGALFMGMSYWAATPNEAPLKRLG